VEQKKLLRQTVLFLGIAVVLGILVVVVIVPGVIRILGGAGGGVATQTEDLPPLQAPVISAPIPATFSASIKLSGYAEKGATVVLLQNTQEANRTTAQDNGAFQFDVQLQKGDNALSAYAQSSADRQSPVSQEFKVIMDDEQPALEIETPTDKQVIEGKKNQSLTIKGKTDPNTKVTVNDRLAFTQADGTFSTTFFLNSGDNNLSIKAIDQAGNVTEKPLLVTFHE
jgi:hypothetical protein